VHRTGWTHAVNMVSHDRTLLVAESGRKVASECVLWRGLNRNGSSRFFAGVHAVPQRSTTVKTSQHGRAFRVAREWPIRPAPLKRGRTDRSFARCGKLSAVTG